MANTSDHGLNGTANERCERLAERVAAFQAAFEEYKVAQRELHAADLRATNITATSVQERLEKVNEFRAQLSDQAGSFLPRTEYDVNHKALGLRVDQGDKALDAQIGVIREAQIHKVDEDKFQDLIKTDKEAREKALERIDEKLNDYISRSELRSREIDTAIATQATVAQEARRYSEKAAQQAKDHAQAEAEKARLFASATAEKSRRNIGIIAVVATVLIAGVQLWSNAMGVAVPPFVG